MKDVVSNSDGVVRANVGYEDGSQVTRQILRAGLRAVEFARVSLAQPAMPRAERRKQARLLGARAYRIMKNLPTTREKVNL